MLEGPNAFEWAVGWLRRYEGHAPWSFCWRITLEGMAATLAMLLLLLVIRLLFNRSWFSKKEEPVYLTPADILIDAPFYETLLFQALPIGLLSWMGASFGTQFIVSAFLFMSAHFMNSVGSGLAAGLTGGVYFAFTYAYWLPISPWTALWVTAASHALHNAPIVPFLTALRRR